MRIAEFLLAAHQRWMIHLSCCLLTLVAALDSHVLMRAALETFSSPISEFVAITRM